MPNRGNTASKTDMSERVRSTAHDGVEAAMDVATTAANRAAAIAGAAVGRAQARMASLRSSIERADLPYMMRRPVPLGAILGGAVTAAVVMHFMSRKRP